MLERPGSDGRFVDELPRPNAAPWPEGGAVADHDQAVVGEDERRTDTHDDLEDRVIGREHAEQRSTQLLG